MNTLEVYDSRFSNTKLVAQAIGEAPEAAVRDKQACPRADARPRQPDCSRAEMGL